ncbi:MAG: hypothetical protein ACYCS8_17740 [Acidithiobacillus sp.]|uniref:hypothetical protein n=1 Tax=Acidithiobacillus thiooxidans TaxID=930 RepID=UPI0009DA607F|nr:hypothetical protein [Acidithiobacillus thiooxidans]
MSEEHTGLVGYKEPERFVFVNAFKVYGIGGALMVEAGRTKPVAPGDPPSIAGEIGIVLVPESAEALAHQILTAIDEMKKKGAPSIQSINLGQKETNG